jgi:PhnB protein
MFMSDAAYPPLSPYIMVRRGPEAIDWYVKVFSATVVQRYDMEDGRVGHASLTINGGSLMLSDEFPENQDVIGTVSPEALGGTTSSINLSVDDTDAWFDRAIAAGATSLRPPQDEFYGRHSKLRDPFGHVWSIVGPKAEA